MLHLTCLALLVSPLIPSSLAHYTLAQDYTGKAFYDGFDFFTAADPTSGHVKYLAKEQANNTGLAGMMNGGLADNAVYLGVDTKNQVPEGRGSVRVESTKSFNHGLILADIVHMPGSVCGTWPAFWMLGAGEWPANGEIDILEGVNEQTSNSIALHTLNSMVIKQDNTSMIGQIKTPDCSVTAPGQPNNAGCVILPNDNTTCGTGFNAIGGGIYATHWTAQAIKIWFFPRTRIPENINAGAPDPSEEFWGKPLANFAGNFSVDSHVRDLRIVFDTTFCGQWAGVIWNESGCGRLAPTCEEYVTNNPDAFAESYWAINSLKVWQAEEDGVAAMRPRKVRRRLGGAVLPYRG